MENQFKVGDVVELKSGGCKMTVEKEGGLAVSCVWMSNDNTCQKAMFHPETIELVKKSKSGVKVFNGIK